jgi:hypothetical protein
MKNKRLHAVSHKLLRPEKLYISYSKLCNGYGVFANDYISSGEIIEEAVYQPVDLAGVDASNTKINNFCYWPPCDEDCPYNDGINTRCKKAVLATGHIQIYNHSSNYNVEFEWHKLRRVIAVRATEDIVAHTEILHYYGPDYGAYETQPLTYCGHQVKRK